MLTEAIFSSPHPPILSHRFTRSVLTQTHTQKHWPGRFEVRSVSSGHQLRAAHRSMPLVLIKLWPNPTGFQSAKPDCKCDIMRPITIRPPRPTLSSQSTPQTDQPPTPPVAWPRLGSFLITSLAVPRVWAGRGGGGWSALARRRFCCCGLLAC